MTCHVVMGIEYTVVEVWVVRIVPRQTHSELVFHYLTRRQGVYEWTEVVLESGEAMSVFEVTLSRV